jgi:hypothetical protein
VARLQLNPRYLPSQRQALGWQAGPGVEHWGPVSERLQISQSLVKA